MFRYPCTVFVCVAITAASSVHADVINRNLLPMGEAEAFRANAGIAGSSPGSVFHNPAGLARLEHPQLSVSGTTLLHFNLSTDEISRLDDEPLPFEASGFLPIPASLVSTYQVGPYALATAILVPDMFELNNGQIYDTPTHHVKLYQSIKRQDLWIGGSVARAFGDKLAIGLSVFGVKRSETHIIFNQRTTQAMQDMPRTIEAQNFSVTATDSLGLTSVVGAMIAPAPWVTIGVRAEPPLLQISTEADIYNSGLEANVLTEADIADLKINLPVPADFGVGIAIRPSQRVTIYADAALQLGKTYRQHALLPSIHLDPAPRFSLGADFHLGRFTLSAGTLLNRSALIQLSDPGDVVEHYWGASAGLTWVKKSVRTGIGAFILRSNALLIPSSYPLDPDPEPVPATTQGVGVLLSVAYML